MEKAWSLALWSVLVCCIAIITDNSKGDGTGKENEWLPCDESGGIDDGYGNEPNATVAYLSSLEGSREERAFELAKNEYLAWLEHKADRYTTVYGYMD